MDLQQFVANADTAAPSAVSGASVGYPSNGDPVNNVPATSVGAYWFYQVISELHAVLTEAGVTPDPGTLNQFLTALQTVARAAAAVPVQQGGTTVVEAPTEIDFRGTGVTVTVDGTKVRVTVTGGGMGMSVTFASQSDALTGTVADEAMSPATTRAVINALINGAPANLNTLDELAAAINDDASFHQTVTDALNARASLSGATFSGTVRTPDPPDDADDTRVATTGWVKDNVAQRQDSLSNEFAVQDIDVVRTLVQTITDYGWIDILFQESIFGVQSVRSRLADLSISTVVMPETLYAINNTNDSLYSIDETTGMSSLIGALGVSASWDSLAGLGTTLYAINNSNHSLYSIDETTGMSSLIGALGVSADLESLAGLGTTLYAINNTNDSLYSIDETTGMSSLIGALGVSASWDSLAGLGTTLYAINNSNHSLYSIDETTGMSSLIGALGVSADLESLAGLGTTLYAINNTNDSLYSIDETTGMSSLIGALGVSGIWDSLAGLGGTTMALGSLLRLSDVKGLIVWRPANTTNQLAFRRSGTSRDLEVLDVIGIP